MELPWDSLTAKGLENQECMWDYLLALRKVQLWGWALAREWEIRARM